MLGDTASGNICVVPGVGYCGCCWNKPLSGLTGVNSSELPGTDPAVGAIVEGVLVAEGVEEGDDDDEPAEDELPDSVGKSGVIEEPELELDPELELEPELELDELASGASSA